MEHDHIPSTHVSLAQSSFEWKNVLKVPFLGERSFHSFRHEQMRIRPSPECLFKPTRISPLMIKQTKEEDVPTCDPYEYVTRSQLHRKNTIPRIMPIHHKPCPSHERNNPRDEQRRDRRWILDEEEFCAFCRMVEEYAEECVELEEDFEGAADYEWEAWGLEDTW